MSRERGIAISWRKEREKTINKIHSPEKTIRRVTPISHLRPHDIQHLSVSNKHRSNEKISHNNNYITEIFESITYSLTSKNRMYGAIGVTRVGIDFPFNVE